MHHGGWVHQLGRLKPEFEPSGAVLTVQTASYRPSNGLVSS